MVIVSILPNVEFGRNNHRDDTVSLIPVSIFWKLSKAFKKLLLSLHPDKNRDDPDADAKFMELNEIYEVLKGLSTT